MIRLLTSAGPTAPVTTAGGRRARRVAVATVTLVAAPVTALTVPAPAQAAWETVTVVHDARLQLCVQPVSGARPWIRVRLDNRAGRHAHRGSLGREGGATVTVRAAAGRWSDVGRLRWRVGGSYSSGISDLSGAGAGGGVDPRRLPRC